MSYHIYFEEGNAPLPPALKERCDNTTPGDALYVGFGYGQGLVTMLGPEGLHSLEGLKPSEALIKVEKALELPVEVLPTVERLMISILKITAFAVRNGDSGRRWVVREY